MPRKSKPRKPKTGRSIPPADEVMGYITDEVVKEMREAGIPAQFIYAYKKTGLLLTESGADNYPPDAVDQWQKAITEYFKLEEEAGGEAVPDPRRYKTKIPEILARPLTREEHEDVRRCLAAVDEVLSKPQSVMMRVELAAALLAHACAAGADGAEATGYEGDRQDVFDTFERIAVLRSRELYSQDRA